MCVEHPDDGEPNTDDKKWDGWVDGELVVPKGGPIPANWPSSDDLGKLLVSKTRLYNAGASIDTLCFHLSAGNKIFTPFLSKTFVPYTRPKIVTCV